MSRNQDNFTLLYKQLVKKLKSAGNKLASEVRVFGAPQAGLGEGLRARGDWLRPVTVTSLLEGRWKSMTGTRKFGTGLILGDVLVSGRTVDRDWLGQSVAQRCEIDVARPEDRDNPIQTTLLPVKIFYQSYFKVCGEPFFWNLRQMWKIKKMGVRQHHCRACGKALCDQCSNNRTVMPKNGFEIVPVRTCAQCAQNIPEAHKTPTVTHFDLNRTVIVIIWSFNQGFTNCL